MVRHLTGVKWPLLRQQFSKKVDKVNNVPLLCPFFAFERGYDEHPLDT